jgi:phospholipase/carboxylesterase
MVVPIPPHGGQPVLARGRALGEGRAVVLMLHGRNAGPSNILELAAAFDHPDVTYLAPAAAGGTWYPMGFMAPTEQNEPGISSGISVVHALIERAVASGVPAERIVLLGFSQGACLASTAAQRRPDCYGGVIVYSGGLIGPPGTVWSAEGTLGGTTAFFGCSDRDAHIPEERVRASAAQYERMGAAVTTRIYPGMGHLVNPDEIAFARDLLAQLAGPSGPGRR